MSRSQSKGHTRNPRFTPSHQDVEIYRALTSATAPLTTDDIASRTKAALATIRHTVKWWAEHGLLRRTFVGRRAFYEWSPSEEGKEIAKLLQAAATLEVEEPRQKAGWQSRWLRRLGEWMCMKAEALDKTKT